MTTKSHKVNPADKVEQWPIEKLVPYAKNSRTHSEEQVAQIAASIREWGFTTAVLVDESGSIIAGHGRVMAARKLGMASLPVMVAAGWTDAQKRAYVIADNKLALNAGWDNELLALELGELGDLGFDLDLVGFTDEEIAALMPEQIEPGLTDEDAVPEVPEQPVTVLGDVWVLGKHRLMCGDSTSIDAIQKLTEGQAPDFVFTDPPYGVAVVKDGMVGADFGVAKKGNYKPIIGDETTDTAIEAYNACVAIGAKKIVLWGGNYFSDKLPPSSCWLVWDKRGDSGIVNTFADCELAWTNMTSPARVHKQLWNGMIREGERDKRVHPTQKPVALCEWGISNYTDKNASVLDLFLGSGSTLMACEKTNRKCFGMEMSPDYCDVIIKRWQQFTGKIAVHAETGQPFAEVKDGSTKTHN
jgi:DNA modification methylase